ncbi:MAG: hypothetical protein LBC74_05655 [Planctomycetaceae bacterium]|jgi:hypothetical protein|nr:hypothetical protein [Planctomycetaceae bacterium]
MNPPYAEYGNKLTIKSRGQNKSDVAKSSKVYATYQPLIGMAAREIFVQFFIRIIQTFPNAKLASFSTLKYINAQNFSKFRYRFRTRFKNGFICKADTFDNVHGQFPIGFLIWDFENATKKMKQNCVNLSKQILLPETFRCINHKSIKIIL